MERELINPTFHGAKVWNSNFPAKSATKFKASVVCC